MYIGIQQNIIIIKILTIHAMRCYTQRDRQTDRQTDRDGDRKREGQSKLQLVGLQNYVKVEATRTDTADGDTQ